MSGFNGLNAARSVELVIVSERGAVSTLSIKWQTLIVTTTVPLTWMRKTVSRSRAQVSSL